MQPRGKKQGGRPVALVFSRGPRLWGHLGLPRQPVEPWTVQIQDPSPGFNVFSFQVSVSPSKGLMSRARGLGGPASAFLTCVNLEGPQSLSIWEPRRLSRAPHCVLSGGHREVPSCSNFSARAPVHRRESDTVKSSHATSPAGQSLVKKGPMFSVLMR